jgi:hypothetical protein
LIKAAKKRLHFFPAKDRKMPPVFHTLGATGTASDAAPSATQDETSAAPGAADDFVLATRELIGSTVLGADGREIGKVVDLLIDSEGRLSGYMLTFGGYMGLGCRTAKMSAARGDLARTGQDRGIVLFTDLTPEEMQNLGF